MARSSLRCSSLTSAPSSSRTRGPVLQSDGIVAIPSQLRAHVVVHPNFLHIERRRATTWLVVLRLIKTCGRSRRLASARGHPASPVMHRVPAKDAESHRKRHPVQQQRVTELCSSPARPASSAISGRTGNLAGAGGIEPPNGGIKIRCLTAWLRPIRRTGIAGGQKTRLADSGSAPVVYRARPPISTAATPEICAGPGRSRDAPDLRGLTRSCDACPWHPFEPAAGDAKKLRAARFHGKTAANL